MKDQPLSAETAERELRTNYYMPRYADVIARLSRDIAAKDAEVARLRGGLALCIGMETNTPYSEVRPEDLEGYCDRWAELGRRK